MKISVQKRIGIAFLTLIFVGGAMWLLSDYRSYLFHLKFQIIMQKNNLLNTVLEARRYEKNFFIYYNPADLQEAIFYAKKAEDQLQRIIEEYGNYTATRNLRKHLMNLKKYTASLSRLHSELSRTGPSGKAPPINLAPGSENLETIRTLGREITVVLEKMVRVEQENVTRLIRESRIYLFVGSFFAFILCIVVAFSLFFKVNRPLKQIGRAVRKIAAGEYEKIPPLNTGDEFDAFAASLNKMIGELNKRNEQLIHSRKMASIGTLASGVAHELNNPLNNISTSLQILLEEFDDPDPDYHKELLADAESQVERARDIVKALLEFSRDSSFKPRRTQIKTLVEKTLKLIRGEIPAGIEIVVDIPEDIYAWVDVTRIQQVLINLILNAVQAIDGPGTITIGAAADKKRSQVRIYVKDTGPGIDPAVIDKIFDPFFTTKEVGKGTGLGLAVCHSIVENHGGKIEIKSEPGKGATFTVVLPVPKEAEPDPATRASSQTNEPPGKQ